MEGEIIEIEGIYPFDGDIPYILPEIGCVQEVITSDTLLSLSNDEDNLTFPNGLLPSPLPNSNTDYGQLPQEEQHIDLTNEGVYIRQIVLGPDHPNLAALESAVGYLSNNAHHLYNALLYSTVQLVDSVLMETLRILSTDPSLRRLQAGLEFESELMDTESVHYHHQPIIRGRQHLSCGGGIYSSTVKRKKGGRKMTLKKKCRKREKTSPASQKLLKEWLFAHSSCPYPTEEDKCHLCHLTGLTLQQLNNWFINARRRILPHKKDKQ